MNKTELLKAKIKKTETAKMEIPKMEISKTEIPKTEIPKTTASSFKKISVATDTKIKKVISDDKKEESKKEEPVIEKKKRGRKKGSVYKKKDEDYKLPFGIFLLGLSKIASKLLKNEKWITTEKETDDFENTLNDCVAEYLPEKIKKSKNATKLGMQFGLYFIDRF